jgi:glycerol-3-phosphate acyltransferase PlsY
MNPAPALALVIASYLLGSISFALLLGKLVQGVDLRHVGSGNLGASNTGRTLGRKWGIATYGLDLLKGFIPAAVGLYGFPDAYLVEGVVPLAVAMGLAAFLGHCYPVYLGFRGGKGVATGSGVVLAASWFTFLVGLITFGIVLALSRMMSVSSMLAAIVLPVAYLASWRREALVMPQLAWLTLFLLLAILVIVGHRENIHRIAERTEPRVGRRAP